MTGATKVVKPGNVDVSLGGGREVTPAGGSEKASLQRSHLSLYLDIKNSVTPGVVRVGQEKGWGGEGAWGFQGAAARPVPGIRWAEVMGNPGKGGHRGRLGPEGQGKSFGLHL